MKAPRIDALPPNPLRLYDSYLFTAAREYFWNFIYVCALLHTRRGTWLVVDSGWGCSLSFFWICFRFYGIGIYVWAVLYNAWLHGNFNFIYVECIERLMYCHFMQVWSYRICAEFVALRVVCYLSLCWISSKYFLSFVLEMLKSYIYFRILSYGWLEILFDHYLRFDTLVNFKTLLFLKNHANTKFKPLTSYTHSHSYVQKSTICPIFIHHFLSNSRYSPNYPEIPRTTRLATETQTLQPLSK